VVKIAAKTALTILIILLAVFAIFNFAYPQHMATLTEDMGNYALAVRYTSLRYTYTGDINDLTRCVEDCILSERDDYIADFGGRLIALDGFDEVCATKDEQLGEQGTYTQGTYRRYIYNKVVASTYANGDYDKAVAIAETENGLESFKNDNPIMALAVRIIYEHDGDNATKMITELGKVNTSTEEEITLINNLTKRLYTQTII
jgi:hypothetical protein